MSARNSHFTYRQFYNLVTNVKHLSGRNSPKGSSFP